MTPTGLERCWVNKYSIYQTVPVLGGFGGLGVECWPLVPKFMGSNPAEAVGFLRAKKSSARLPSEGSKAIGPML